MLGGMEERATAATGGLTYSRLEQEKGINWSDRGSEASAGFQISLGLW